MAGKPKFDPSQPFETAQASKPKFNPSQPYAEHVPYAPTPTAQVGYGDTALRGAAQGVTMGFGDELSGALGNVAGKVGLVPDMGYDYYRDYARGKDKEAAAANPKTYLGSQIAGGLTTAVVPGMGAAGSLGKTVAQGAVQGGLTGAGSTEESLATEAGIMDALKGAAYGGAGGAAGYGVGQAVSGRLAAGLRGSAERLAEKATGATGRQAEKFVEGAGRKLLDLKAIRFGDSPANIAERTAAMQNKSGADIGAAIEALDSQGVKASMDNVMIDLTNKIDELRAVPGNEGVIKKISKARDALVERGLNEGWQAPISTGEMAKRNYASQVNYASPEAKKAASAKIASAFRGEVERAASEANPEVAKKFIADKDLFGLLAPVREAAEKRASQLNQSPFGGFGDAMAGAAGAAATTASKGPLAAASMLARRVLAPRTASSMAVGTDTIANILERMNNQVGSSAIPLANAAQAGGRSVGSSPWLNMKEKKK